jgi:hypothetical protein
MLVLVSTSVGQHRPSTSLPVTRATRPTANGSKLRPKGPKGDAFAVTVLSRAGLIEDHTKLRQGGGDHVGIVGLLVDAPVEYPALSGTLSSMAQRSRGHRSPAKSDMSSAPRHSPALPSRRSIAMRSKAKVTISSISNSQTTIARRCAIWMSLMAS